MKLWALNLTLIAACLSCSKATVGTEFGNPPSISPDFVSLMAVAPDRVEVRGAPGAVSPGGGEVAISNQNRGDDPTVVEVAADGSFIAELAGSPDDDYELVASNEHGSSAPRTVQAGPAANDGGPPATVDAGTPSICDLGFQPGPCDAAISVFWHNPSTGRCEAATYGGCEGNDNRFPTLEDCEQSCVDLDALACETDADCAWGEIPHEILAPADCICLYGCPYLALNTTTIARRQAQSAALCDPRRGGNGELCGIDDCISLPPARCIAGQCGGQ